MNEKLLQAADQIAGALELWVAVVKDSRARNINLDPIVERRFKVSTVALNKYKQLKTQNNA